MEDDKIIIHKKVFKIMKKMTYIYIITYTLLLLLLLLNYYYLNHRAKRDGEIVKKVNKHCNIILSDIIIINI